MDDTPQSKRRLVAVLGMHRGGTSVAARALSVLGCDLGDALPPGTPGENEKGFWEDQEIRAVNEELLGRLNCDWDSLFVHIPVGFATEHCDLVDEAVQLLGRKTSGALPFGFKDPRFVRLLPFWREVFRRLRVDVSYLFVCRNPLSVVASLAKRNGFGPDKCFSLWLSHMLAGMRVIHEQPTAVMDYDLLLADPAGQLARISRLLGLPVCEDLLTEFSSSFLESRLRTTVFSAEALSDAAVPWQVRDAYSMLLRLARDDAHRSAPEIQDTLCKLEREFNDGKLFLDALTRKQETSSEPPAADCDEMEQLRSEITRARRIIDHRDEGIAWLRGELTLNMEEAERLRERLVAAEAIVAERDEQIRQLSQELEALQRAGRKDLGALAGALRGAVAKRIMALRK